MREALANAFAHRSYTVAGRVQVRIYSDPLEVLSSGGLHFGRAVADLCSPHSSWPWSPHILAAFYRRGIVEQLGSGTLRMIRLCAEAGLGVPVFTARINSLTCTIPRRGYRFGSDGARVILTQDEVTPATGTGKGSSHASRASGGIGTASLGVRDAMNRLHKHGLADSQGHGRGAHWSTGRDNHTAL